MHAAHDTKIGFAWLGLQPGGDIAHGEIKRSRARARIHRMPTRYDAAARVLLACWTKGIALARCRLSLGPCASREGRTRVLGMHAVVHARIRRTPCEGSTRSAREAKRGTQSRAARPETPELPGPTHGNHYPGPSAKKRIVSLAGAPVAALN